MTTSTFLRILFFLFLSLPFNSHSQKLFDLNGVFEGYRQTETDSLESGAPHLYIYDLKQDGLNITGKSFIYNDNGYYAEVLVHGVIVDDKLYFEEYNTQDQVNPENKDWCYESGKLSISVQDGKISLKGETKSFSKKYGFFCSKGYINLEKLIPLANSNDIDENSALPSVTDVKISPNPTENIAQVAFVLNESHLAIIEVYNLEGELILSLLNRTLSSGSYSFEIDLSFEEEGMYIVELIVDKKIFSTELYKSRF